MKIRIEQKHIDSGKPSFAHSCALALAIKEQTGLQISCYELVHLTNADGSQGQTVCKLADLACDWIKRFDSDKSSVQPTVIGVPWPRGSLRALRERSLCVAARSDYG